jgi:hypothetical protein
VPGKPGTFFLVRLSGVKRILVLTALKMEASAVARALGAKRVYQRGPHIYRAANLTVVALGMQAKHLASVAEQTPDVAILAGVAGGLAPDLKCGDVVVEGFDGLAGARVGTVATAPGVVSSAQEKAALYERTGALTVDMEGDAVRARYPSIIQVRAVLDEAGEYLPAELAGVVNDFGVVQAPALLGLLLKRPYMIATLIRLGRKNARACSAMARAVKAIVEMHHPLEKTRA